MKELVTVAPMIAGVGQTLTLLRWRGTVLRRLPLVAAMLPVCGAGMVGGRLLLHSLPHDAASPAVGSLFLLVALHGLTQELGKAIAKPPSPPPAEGAEDGQAMAEAEPERDCASQGEEPSACPAQLPCREVPAEADLQCSELRNVPLSCIPAARAIHGAVPPHHLASDARFILLLWLTAGASGFIFGLIATPGPPFATFFASAATGVDDIRAFVSPTVLALYIASVGMSWARGTLRAELLRPAAAAMVAAGVGFTFGSRVLARYVSPSAYRRVLYGLIVISGLNLCGAWPRPPQNGPWYTTAAGPVALTVLGVWFVCMAAVAAATLCQRSRQRDT
eukprot:TRINITY_DN37946_c0_g1_i1.p1 TRINITY_DN37946_c0_g1~~TRINITY_DN37946_c0_g1_i1.p1  ORF type:complete len:335 (+),score=49.07 TRINITY_DN37946_c0_g1_i1:347-1351(+)